ncbi:MAG: glycosyltransferase family 2 protein [Desulfobacteraceae bacterium]
MQPNFRLSIVIPAYNEQDRIVTTLRETIAYLDRRPYASELLVISDGSSDQTAQVARNFQTPEHVILHVVEYHPNRGKGYAVKTGMLKTQGKIAMFMDADYAVPIQCVEKGMALIDDGHDIAIASRAVSGAHITLRQNIWRTLSARIYTWIQNGYLGVDYPDTQCGFKLFTNSAAKILFHRQRLESVIFDPEILWLARKAGLVVGQFPVQWSHVADSRIQYDTLGKSLFVFQELFRIKRLHTKSAQVANKSELG